MAYSSTFLLGVFILFFTFLEVFRIFIHTLFVHLRQSANDVHFVQRALSTSLYIFQSIETTRPLRHFGRLQAMFIIEIPLKLLFDFIFRLHQFF